MKQSSQTHQDQPKKNQIDFAKKVTELANQNTELLNDLQRTRADFENYRKQVDFQKEQAKNITTQSVVMKILPLLDDIDRAISAHPAELGPIQKNLEKTLEQLNLSKIDTKEGIEFNPNFHEAISVDQGTGEKEVISATLRPGYLYQKQVIRPAMVKVKLI